MNQTKKTKQKPSRSTPQTEQDKRTDRKGQKDDNRINVPKTDRVGKRLERMHIDTEARSDSTLTDTDKDSVTSGARKRVSASTIEYRKRRAAFHHLNRLNQKGRNNWDADDLAQFEQSNKLVEEWKSRPKTEPSTSKQARKEFASKRPRSQDDPPSTSKKTRTSVSASKPLNEVMKEHLIIAIIDRGHDECQISREHWGVLECKINLSLLSLCKNDPSKPLPSFRERGWHPGGFKLIACDDASAVDFIKSAVAAAAAGDLWTGAKPEAVNKEEIPLRPRARAWVPMEPSDPQDILLLIQRQNPDIPSHNWKVLKSEVVKDKGRSITMLLNPESLAPLKTLGNEVRYCLKTIRLKIYEQDEKHAPGAVPAVSSSFQKRQDTDDPSSDSEDTDITVIESSGLIAITNDADNPDKSPSQ